MNVLGIETSCDETGIAIYNESKGLVIELLYSQIPLHAQYGGVVPELASRDHIKKVPILTQQALQDSHLELSQIDAIAYTAGPGLVGALMVGACFAKSMGYALNIPTLGINHLEAHLHAVMLEKTKPAFPFIALLVSGGHTALIAVKQLGEYQILGETLDDAVGEAFDKTAKLLGLSYPGGAALAELALKGKPHFQFPRPMSNKPTLDFSYSGLKTHVANLVKKLPKEEQLNADIAFAFQQAAIEILVIKARKALELTEYHSLVIAGGVGANHYLREQLAIMVKPLKVELFYPRPHYCTDNGAMVAYLGLQRLRKGEVDEGHAINVRARWSLEELTPP